MAIECRDEFVVSKSCQLDLFGRIALTHEDIAVGFATRCDSLDADQARLKARNHCKKNLAAAKSAKRDEFYTQYKDIKRELDLYYEFNPNVFRGKVIYMPCDDPRTSNFNRYFLDNFNRFGIKRIICSCYNPKGVGKLFVYDGANESDGQMSLSRIECSELCGNGDFRSEEVTELCKQADIIITNPPFSLFRQFFTWIMSSQKQFLIIGNVNCISYKEVYPHIMKDQVWLGHGIGRWISGFIVPKDYELYGTETRIDEEGNHIISSNGCLWLTNIDHGRRHQPLDLMTEAANIKGSKHRDVRSVGYLKYDNCDAIEVPHTDAIPSDYKGLMGVPITFLDKYCPEQFELVRFRKGDNGKDLTINGKPTYFRILIRAKCR
ncbi:MAG: adenine-specific methyltransferase EcoRI family protein [Kiritimatiellia bacterium]